MKKLQIKPQFVGLADSQLDSCSEELSDLVTKMNDTYHTDYEVTELRDLLVDSFGDCSFISPRLTCAPISSRGQACVMSPLGNIKITFQQVRAKLTKTSRELISFSMLIENKSKQLEVLERQANRLHKVFDEQLDDLCESLGVK